MTDIFDAAREEVGEEFGRELKDIANAIRELTAQKATTEPLDPIDVVALKLSRYMRAADQSMTTMLARLENLEARCAELESAFLIHRAAVLDAHTPASEVKS